MMVQISEPVNLFLVQKMGISERLKEERQRLGLTQTAFGELAGAGKTTVISWERGTAYPNAAFLEAAAAAGADIQYIVTGERDGPPPVTLTTDEQVLLEGYRALDAATRRRMLAFMLGGEKPLSSVDQARSINIQGNGGQVAGRDINNGGMPSGDNDDGRKRNK